MNKDNLFKKQKIESDFVFNKEVAQIFDDMLNRSIPHYREVIDLISQILNRYLPPNPAIYDLGCSTGNTLIYLAGALKEKKPNLTGFDNSSDMIEKAKEKAKAYGKNIAFFNKDIFEAEIENADAIILNYTLQFIRPLKREQLLKKLRNSLKKDGVLILSEKIVFNHPVLNRDFTEIYYDFKKRMGYSELEIAKKREALENILIPFTLEENLSLLKQAGFTFATPFFQWVNFVSIIAVK